MIAYGKMSTGFGCRRDANCTGLGELEHQYSLLQVHTMRFVRS